MKLLVLDIGGTEIKYALMRDPLDTSAAGRIRTVRNSREQFLQQLQDIYLLFRDQAEGIAVAMPGVVDPRTGFVKNDGALEYFQNEDFAGLLSGLCGGVPVAVENDGKAAGLAELRSGTLSECQNGLLLILGTGIGSCVVVDRKIVRGRNDFAGELTYTIVGPAPSREHPQAGKKWWETNSINVLLRELAEKEGGDPAQYDGLYFFKKAEAGDEAALEILRRYCRNLVTPIANIQTIIDPEVVAISGGITRNPLLLQMLQEEYDAFLSTDYGYLHGVRCRPKICRSTYLNHANLIGAYYNFLNVFEEEQR